MTYILDGMNNRADFSKKILDVIISWIYDNLVQLNIFEIL